MQETSSTSFGEGEMVLEEGAQPLLNTPIKGEKSGITRGLKGAKPL